MAHVADAVVSGIYLFPGIDKQTEPEGQRMDGQASRKEKGKQVSCLYCNHDDLADYGSLARNRRKIHPVGSCQWSDYPDFPGMDGLLPPEAPHISLCRCPVVQTGRAGANLFAVLRPFFFAVFFSGDVFADGEGDDYPVWRGGTGGRTLGGSRINLAGWDGAAFWIPSFMGSGSPAEKGKHTKADGKPALSFAVWYGLWISAGYAGYGRVRLWL